MTQHSTVQDESFRWPKAVSQKLIMSIIAMAGFSVIGCAVWREAGVIRDLSALSLYFAFTLCGVLMAPELNRWRLRRESA